MYRQRLDDLARQGGLGIRAERALIFGADVGRRKQPDEFLPRIPVHRRRGGVGFDHAPRFQVVDDQPVAGGFEDRPINIG